MIDQGFRVVDTQPWSAATKWILNAVLALDCEGTSASRCKGVCCQYGEHTFIQSLFLWGWPGKVRTVLLHQTRHDICCSFQWQMSSCEHVNVFSRIPIYLKEAPETDGFYYCMLCSCVRWVIVTDLSFCLSLLSAARCSMKHGGEDG